MSVSIFASTFDSHQSISSRRSFSSYPSTFSNWSIKWLYQCIIHRWIQSKQTIHRCSRLEQTWFCFSFTFAMMRWIWYSNILAPTDATLHDFIRMIWQLRIQSIITVTRLFEDGKVTRLMNCRIVRLIGYVSSINACNIGQMKAKNESMSFEFVQKAKKITAIIPYENLRSTINQRYEDCSRGIDISHKIQ